MGLFFFFKQKTAYEISACLVGSEMCIRDSLCTIIDKFKGGPVGLTTIATALGEDAGTIEEVYEPFLIKEGFLKRTPRGREVTELAYMHLGRSIYNSQKTLFDD